MTRPAPLPSCVWVTDALLVGGLKNYTVKLPALTVERLAATGVGCVINLLSKDQFQAAGADMLWGGVVEATPTVSAPQGQKIFVTHSFWSVGGDILPTARQVRLTLDDIDDLHACNQTVLVNGAGYPARAVIAAGCWLARHRGNHDARIDPQTARLGWLDGVRDALGDEAAAVWSLDEAERAFVSAWPPGRDAEPVRTRLELLDEEEPYPTTTVEHWLRVLPTVRVYPRRAGPRASGGRAGARWPARKRRRGHRLGHGGNAPGYLDRRAHATPDQRLAGGLRLPVPMTATGKRYRGIETFGIVSASNEAGRLLSEAENDRRDEHLLRDLVGYETHQVRGRFGDVSNPLLSMVNPFAVVNVARETVVALGAKYHQFHVIFGVREGGGEDLVFRFQLVEADGAGPVLAVRKLFAHPHRHWLYLDAGSPGDCGRFFVVPGMDENPAFSESSSTPCPPPQSAMTADRPSNDASRLRKGT